MTRKVDNEQMSARISHDMRKAHNKMLSDKERLRDYLLTKCPVKFDDLARDLSGNTREWLIAEVSKAIEAGFIREEFGDFGEDWVLKIN